MTLTKSGRRVGRPPKLPELTISAPLPHERQEFVDRLQAIIDALEIGDLPKDVRLFLQKKLRRHDFLRSVDAKRFHAKGEEEVTILLRTVFESSNGAAALTMPILPAVSGCMEPRWVDHGLAWIEFFDSVGLVRLLEQIRALDFCDEGDLETHLREAFGGDWREGSESRKSRRQRNLRLVRKWRDRRGYPSKVGKRLWPLRKKRPKARRMAA
jgi:hypothetical protein